MILPFYVHVAMYVVMIASLLCTSHAKPKCLFSVYVYLSADANYDLYSERVFISKSIPQGDTPHIIHNSVAHAFLSTSRGIEFLDLPCPNNDDVYVLTVVTHPFPAQPHALCAASTNVTNEFNRVIFQYITWGDETSMHCDLSILLLKK